MKKFLFGVVGILLKWVGIIYLLLAAATFFLDLNLIKIRLWVLVTSVLFVIIGSKFKDNSDDLCWCGEKKKNGNVIDASYEGTEEQHTSTEKTRTTVTRKKYCITIECPNCGRTWSENRYKTVDREENYYN